MKSKPRDCGNYWRSLPILINIDQILLWSDLWAYDEFGRWLTSTKKKHGTRFPSAPTNSKCPFSSCQNSGHSEVRSMGGVRSSVWGYIFKLPKDFATRSSALGLFFFWCIVPYAFGCNKAMRSVLGLQGCFFIDPMAMMLCVAWKWP